MRILGKILFFFLHKDCLLEHAIIGKTEGRIAVMERRRTCKQPLDDLKEKKGYWEMKEEGPNYTL
jgi:hypothetical protein